MSDLHSISNYDSSYLHISDVHCRAHRSGTGEEEIVDSPRLIFPRRGVFTCHTGHEMLVADSNSVLLFNGGDTYRVSHPSDAGDDCSVLVLPPEVFSEAFRASGQSLQPFPAPLAFIDSQTQYLQRLLHRVLQNDWRDSLAIEEEAGALLERVAHAWTSPAKIHTTSSGQRRLVEQVRSLLASQPEARLTLQQIAQQVHCSPYYLSRLFRAEAGSSLHQYRLQLRLATALERMSQGEDNLSRLALDLGFDSHSHFSASFKRFFGSSPSQAREQLTTARCRELSKILIAS